MAWNSYPSSALTVSAIWNPSAPQDPTSYAVQKELRKKGYYTTAYLLDGHFGPSSVKALQRYLRDYGRYEAKYTGLIDGSIGRMTRGCMADYLSVNGNPYGVAYYFAGSYPSYFPDYNLTVAWQKFMNNRRNKA